MLSVHPIGARVIARKVKPRLRTASGLALPEAHVESPQFAIVDHVGDGHYYDGPGEIHTLRSDDIGVQPATVEVRKYKRQAPVVQPGDVVIYPRRAGAEVEVEGLGTVFVLREDEILAVVRGEPQEIAELVGENEDGGVPVSVA
jgi:co-chaperonin GroES (HSP10)